MDSFLRMYFEGGPFMYILSLFFFAAILILLVQLALSRITIFPGLFLGLATAIFALAVISMARDLLIVLEVLPTIKDPNLKHYLGTNAILLIPILFSLIMVIILSVLQIAADLLTNRNLVLRSSPAKVPRILGRLAVICLLVSAALCTHTMMITNRQVFAELASITSERVSTLIVFQWSSIIIGSIAVFLSMATILVSIVLAFRQLVQPKDNNT
jgi:hypothetical protein